MAANTAQERNAVNLLVAEPVVSNTNSKKRRSHNTAERINCISQVLHVLRGPGVGAFTPIPSTQGRDGPSPTEEE